MFIWRFDVLLHLLKIHIIKELSHRVDKMAQGRSMCNMRLGVFMSVSRRVGKRLCIRVDVHPHVIYLRVCMEDLEH